MKRRRSRNRCRDFFRSCHTPSGCTCVHSCWKNVDDTFIASVGSSVVDMGVVVVVTVDGIVLVRDCITEVAGVVTVVAATVVLAFVGSVVIEGTG